MAWQGHFVRPGPRGAIDILKRRLASGEIGQDDHDRMRRALQ